MRTRASAWRDVSWATEASRADQRLLRAERRCADGGAEGGDPDARVLRHELVVEIRLVADEIARRGALLDRALDRILQEHAHRMEARVLRVAFGLHDDHALPPA